MRDIESGRISLHGDVMYAYVHSDRKNVTVNVNISFKTVR